MTPLPSRWRRSPSLALLFLAALAPLPCFGQIACTRDVVTGPYTVSPGAPQQTVRSLTITFYGTRGNIIATYTFTRFNPGAIQIKQNGQPLNYDPTDPDAPPNPLGFYNFDDALEFEESLCPVESPFGPPSAGSLRAFAAAAPPVLPVFGQTANLYVSADFNNDSVPDNATAGSGRVQITLYSSTTGALTSTNITVGGAANTAIVAGDFNGDGNTDLAVTVFNNSGPGSVAVLLGKGDGTFAAPVNYPTGVGPLSLAAADLNGDGKLDLVVSSSDTSGFLPVGTLQVLLGKGDGTFATPASYSAGRVPQSLIATDLNGDGRPDVAALDTQGPPAYDQLLVFLSNPDGSLQPSLAANATGTYFGALAYTDLNHDGKLDLAVADSNGSDLTVLTGNGDGTFQAPRAYVYAPHAASVGIVPLLDGTTALLSANALDGSLLVTQVNAAGAVGSSPIQTLGTTLSAATAADLNGDGKPDIVITDQGGSRVFVMVNSGGYQFTTPASYSLNASPSATAIADVNGDGKPDLVIADTNGIDVLPGKGDGTFGAAQTSAVPGTGAGVVGPALADFNGDGKPDAIVAVGGTVSLLSGQGNGTFSAGAAAVSIGGSVNPVAVAAGDWNGDGKPDFAFAYGVTSGTTYSGFLAVALGNGGGTFRSSTIPLPAGPVSLAIGDVNKDGKPDLIVGMVESTGPNLAVFLGNGDGTFQSPKITSTSAYLPSIAITDFNGDGNPDLLLGDCCGISEATVLFGNGDGTFQTELPFPSGPNPTYLAVADFNGDGKPDLAIAGSRNNAGTLVVLSNATPGVNQATVVSSANPSGTAIAPGSLADAYGADLANSAPAATSLPLPVTFGGTSVSIRDSTGATAAAPLLYVSAAQVDFLVPSTAAAGPATVTITSGDGTQSAAPVTIAPVAPGVFTLNAANLVAAVAIRVGADASQTEEPVYTVDGSGAVVAAPVSLGSSTDTLVLEIYGTGIRAAGTAGVTVTMGGVALQVSYAGAQGGYDGLDQVNVTVPHSLAGAGSVPIRLTANGIAANVSYVTIQ